MNNNTSNKVALVTGGSSGIGLETCKLLVEKGFTVYEFSRHEHSSGTSVHHMSVDVTNEQAVKEAVTDLLQKEKAIDLLINNAGFGISGAIEFTDSADARAQMDVNFFGMVYTTQAVLSSMRQRRCGTIVNISSIAAPFAIPFQAYYSASKAAIRNYTLALRGEVSPFGIHVVCIQPGDVKTGFTSARHKSQKGDDIYCGRISKSVAGMEHDETTGIAPEKAAKVIVKHALARHPGPVYSIGTAYKLFLFLGRILPTPTIVWLIGLLYGHTRDQK